MSADTTPGLEAERAAFEEWAMSKGWKPTHLHKSVVNGSYAWSNLNAAWEVWQAARRTPAPAPQGPTDAEIEALWADQQGFHPNPVVFARGVLARWGAPAASGEPVARKPLTEEQRRQMWRTSSFRGTGGQLDWFVEGTRAAEQYHGIKP